MKKLYMRIIVGSSRRDCVLIILFQLHGSKAELFEGNLLLKVTLHSLQTVYFLKYILRVKA